MRPTDSGKGTGKAIFSTVLVAAMIYAGVKILPVYIHNYQLNDYLRETTFGAMAGARPTAESVRQNIVAKAQEFDLPVRPENVSVALSFSKIEITVDYIVPINLILFTWNAHFAPSAENRGF